MPLVISGIFIYQSISFGKRSEKFNIKRFNDSLPTTTCSTSATATSAESTKSAATSATGPTATA